MLMYFTLLFLLLSGILVFYSLSPYYSALGLVSAALLGCIILAMVGLPFLALVFLLVYLGGMLVVFVYSSALSADQYPEVGSFTDMFLLIKILGVWFFFMYSNSISGVCKNMKFLLSSDLNGLGILFKSGGYYLLISGVALLVALVMVLMMSSNKMKLALRHM